VSARALAALLLLLTACQSQGTGSGSASAGGGKEPPDALAEARQLLAQGQPDAVLARLQGAGDPDALLLQGQAWAKKAQTAPLPTAPPMASPAPRGAAPPSAPELKPEELQAVDFYERAVAARPDLGAAHLALAELLGPHALARVQRSSASAKSAAPGRRPGRRSATPEPVPSALPGPDASPARVLREYRLAAQADPSTAIVEAWILFATSAGGLDDAEAAMQELVKRIKERPEPFVRYGDFLLATKKDPEGAIAQYRQALIWKADDEAVKAKVADIYLGMAADHLSRHEYSSAEVRIKEAQKYVANRTSPQGQKLQELQAEVALIRGRPPGR